MAERLTDEELAQVRAYLETASPAGKLRDVQNVATMARLLATIDALTTERDQARARVAALEAAYPASQSASQLPAR